MSSSVQTFISSINKYHSLQRQSRFKVFFPSIPKCCPTLADLTLRCESVDLPGRSFNTFDHRTYGPIIKYPTQSFFSEITLTFLCSSNKSGRLEVRDDRLGVGGRSISSPPFTGMDEKVTFENWMNYINSYPSRSSTPQNQVYHNFRYRNDYVAPINVICYDTSDVASYMMDFEEAYPIVVSPVSMTWGSEEVARVSVTFTYKYFRYTNMCECKTEEPVLYATTQQEVPRKSEAQRQGPPITPETAETLPPQSREQGLLEMEGFPVNPSLPGQQPNQ